MTIISQLELAGSPVEQASWAQQTWYWDPSAELLAGETLSAPTCSVYKYDPAYAANTADYQNVSSTVLVVGSPTIGTGVHANQVQVIIASGALVPGFAYQVRLSCLGSLGSTPARYFRILCRV